MHSWLTRVWLRKNAAGAMFRSWFGCLPIIFSPIFSLFSCLVAYEFRIFSPLSYVVSLPHTTALRTHMRSGEQDNSNVDEQDMEAEVAVVAALAPVKFASALVKYNNMNT